WASEPRITRAITTPAAREDCARFLASATRGAVIVGVELVSAIGTPLCASSPEQAKIAPVEASWYQAALDGSLASEGIVQGPRGPALTLAMGIAAPDSSLGVLRAWYDWGAIAQMIEGPLSQARLADGQVHLQLSARDRVLYDSSPKDAALLEPGAGAD